MLSHTTMLILLPILTSPACQPATYTQVLHIHTINITNHEHSHTASPLTSKRILLLQHTLLIQSTPQTAAVSQVAGRTRISSETSKTEAVSTSKKYSAIYLDKLDVQQGKESNRPHRFHNRCKRHPQKQSIEEEMYAVLNLEFSNNIKIDPWAW